MVTRPTQEDAPVTVAVWLPQRTRWFKGWLQTWLVHMRTPRLLWREAGPASFAICQILFAGMVLSALAHPVFLLTMLYIMARLAMGGRLGGWQSAIFAVDCANISLGYLTFLLLGRRTLDRKERKGFWKTVLLTPPYWFLLSAAALRAVWKLYTEPHRWEKTPHLRRAGAVDPSSRRE
jgi:cellulose synthase/poly-beta-1,6-N-acetylglucosamine synthase-like glycosyltransferase